MRGAGCVVLRNLLSGSSCRLRATGKIGEFTRDTSQLPNLRTLLAEACRASTNWRRLGPREWSSGHMVSAGREARYVPSGVRETSRRVDRTGRGLIEKSKIERTLLLKWPAAYSISAGSVCEVLEGLEGESPWGWMFGAGAARDSLANGLSPDPAGLARKYPNCWPLTVLFRPQLRLFVRLVNA